MKKIEVGMLVRCMLVINRPVTPEMKHLIGRVGVVLRPSSVHADSWIVEGAMVASDGLPCSWRSESLEPIDPDHEPRGESYREVIDSLKGVTA